MGLVNRKAEGPPLINPGFEHIEDQELRINVMINSHDDNNLSDVEQLMILKIKEVLDRKLESGDYELHAANMLKWFRKYVTGFATEFYIRRLVNKYEWDYIGHILFTYKHGDPLFKRQDEVRLSCFQNWAESLDKKNEAKSKSEQDTQQEGS